MSAESFDTEKPFGIGNGINEYWDDKEQKKKADAQRAITEGTAASATTAAAPEQDEESPVEGTPVHEAARMIAKMRSRDKLQHIVANDQRAGVKDAARRRLSELGQ